MLEMIEWQTYCRWGHTDAAQIPITQTLIAFILQPRCESDLNYSNKVLVLQCSDREQLEYSAAVKITLQVH